MQKSKRKTQPNRFSRKFIALIWIAITAIAGYTGYQYFQTEPVSTVTQLDLSAATVSETDDIQWMGIEPINEPIFDVAFSEDSSSWYALGQHRLYKMELNGTESQFVASVSFPSEYEAYTMAVYPGANQIAIGTMQRDGDGLSAAILFVDMPNLQLIDTVFESENQNNRGSSIELAFTPDGSRLYHLYNLNNYPENYITDCSTSFNTLEYWDMGTHQSEVYSLPSQFAWDFAVSDDALAVQIDSNCSRDTSAESHLIFFSNDGRQIRFPSTNVVLNYRNLAVSHNQQLIAGTRIYRFYDEYYSMALQIWDDEELSLNREFRTDSFITGLAFSPDNHHIVMGVYRGGPIELHFVNLQTGQIDNSIQTEITQGGVRQVIFSPDGHYLLASGLDEQRMWYLP